MIKIAVTGGPGSGKSTVCRVFEELGAYSINLDMLARDVVRPGSHVLKAISEKLGNHVLSPDGRLDRGKTRRLISRDPEAKKVLERLTHPEIFKRLQKALDDIGMRHRDAVIAIEIPLLIEVGAQDQFDVVVLVVADPEIQKRRIMIRDGVSGEETTALLRLQIPSEKKRAYADYVVENVGPIDEVRPVVAEIYGQIVGGL
jgi:dephospho-CoA kinase